MAVYLFTNNELPIFDATGAVITLNSAGQPVDQIGNVITITTANGFKNHGESPPREIIQLPMPIRVASLVYFVTSRLVSTPQAPTTIPKFTRTPAYKNLNNIDCKTKSGDALYYQASRSLYSDRELSFLLTSEGFLPFF